MTGRINVYTCRGCGNQRITRDQDEGVTPMLLMCDRVHWGPNEMVSAGYQCDQNLNPTHEWFKPSLKSARRKGPAFLEHVKRGGLDIRPISGQPEVAP